MARPDVPGITGVDCHMHVTRLGARLVDERHSAPGRDAGAAQALAVLDGHGLSHGLLTQPSFYGTDNSLLLAALAEDPSRLRGTVIVDVDAEDAPLASYRDLGVRGVRLNWLRRAALPDVGSPSFARFLGRVRDAGLHVELYVEGARLASLLPEFLVSGVVVVLDHFGAPDPAEGLGGPGFRAVLDAVAGGRAWVKLSAPYRLAGVDPAACAKALLAAGGPERLLWGSDWPWVSHEDGQSYPALLAAFERWIPDADQRDAILRRSPADLLGLDPPAP